METTLGVLLITGGFIFYLLLPGIFEHLPLLSSNKFFLITLCYFLIVVALIRNTWRTYEQFRIRSRIAVVVYCLMLSNSLGYGTISLVQEKVVSSRGTQNPPHQDDGTEVDHTKYVLS